jgi:hypothetical protein
MSKSEQKKRDLPSASEVKRIRPGRQRKASADSAQAQAQGAGGHFRADQGVSAGGKKAGVRAGRVKRRM